MVFKLSKVPRLATVVKRYIPARTDTYQIFSLTLLIALDKVKVSSDSSRQVWHKKSDTCSAIIMYTGSLLQKDNNVERILRRNTGNNR